MYSSNLLESGFALTTGKHTQMTKENSKGMKDLSASNVSHVSRKPLQCIQITTPYTDYVVEATFRNHDNAYDMICSLIDHGFFPVFSIEGKVMLYSNVFRFSCFLYFLRNKFTLVPQTCICNLMPD